MIRVPRRNDTHISNRKPLVQLMKDWKIACVWAISYSDPQIWEEVDNTECIYHHRIATNPNFRRNNFVKTIVAWAQNSLPRKIKKVYPNGYLWG